MGIFKTWEYFGSQKNLLLILDAVNFHIGNFSNLKNKNCFVGLIFFNFVKKGCYIPNPNKRGVNIYGRRVLTFTFDIFHDIKWIYKL